MIPSEIERLWADYVATEQIRIRRESLDALNRFVRTLSKLPTEVWHPWARKLASRIVDEGEKTPIRMPLFRSVLFPSLLEGIQSSVTGSARWMAGFAPFLYKSPSCAEQLPESRRTEFGLLKLAIQDDPSDHLSKQRLLTLMRSRFDYLLHELPAGLLYGNDSATIQECDVLLEELSEYELLATEIGAEEEDRELLAEARFHIPAYRRYLSNPANQLNYKAFLSKYEQAP